MKTRSFETSVAALAACLAGLTLLAGCPPPQEDPGVADSQAAAAQQTYMAAPNKIYDAAAPFDLTWGVVYESKEKPFDPAINVTNRQLALNRCNQCHECGFRAAFDMERFGTPTWRPIYVGEQWAPVVRRMVDMPNSFMNEQIAERIYNYLNEESQGLYDESKDPRGSNTIGGRNAEAGRVKAEDLLRQAHRPER